MKTKVFAYEITKGLWVLALARIINGKCYVSYVYAESQKPVDGSDLAKITRYDIELWCDKNNATLWSY